MKQIFIEFESLSVIPKSRKKVFERKSKHYYIKLNLKLWQEVCITSLSQVVCVEKFIFSHLKFMKTSGFEQLISYCNLNYICNQFFAFSKILIDL
jgi:hypothetical protein